nr:unnamed protein product [Callosobruchus analis]
MEVEEEIFLDDDMDILDIINFGFPRRLYERPNYIEDMDDLGFLRRFRITKATAVAVLELIEDQLEFENDLNNSVSPLNQLLTALLFYATNGHQINIGDHMGMNQSTVSRIVGKVSRAIAGLRNRFIKMPSTPEEHPLSEQFLSFGTFSSSGEDGEVYRNRKSYFSINVQLVCDRNLKINNIVARWPGSANDATIFNHSRLRTRFEAGEFGNSVMLGDSGYPLTQYLLTRLANPDTQPHSLYNESHIRTRNCIERTNGVWKRRFPALCYGLRCKTETNLAIVVATTVLHNIALTMHDEIPPSPEGINDEELNYLIDQGQIPQINLTLGNDSLRSTIVNNYFANL